MFTGKRCNHLIRFLLTQKLQKSLNPMLAMENLITLGTYNTQASRKVDILQTILFRAVHILVFCIFDYLSTRVLVTRLIYSKAIGRLCRCYFVINRVTVYFNWVYKLSLSPIFHTFGLLYTDDRTRPHHNSNASNYLKP